MERKPRRRLNTRGKKRNQVEMSAKHSLVRVVAQIVQQNNAQRLDKHIGHGNNHFAQMCRSKNLNTQILETRVHEVRLKRRKYR
jgi:hypothetical protein